MEILTTIREVKEWLQGINNNGITIGFVPTMGALHPGHLSLVNYSKNQCDKTVVSIFVNPIQFNDPEDYKKYPRNVETDIEMLSGAGCDMVFLPSETEIYPEPDTRIFDLGQMETIMEGKFRVGHFQGVARVVSKLFEIVNPQKAFFGQKDFQQVAIIKKLVRILNSSVEIVECPIVRESNGLAMSSRNQRLSAKEFEEAAIIYKTISQLPSMIKNYTIPELKRWVAEQINSSRCLKIEYVDIVDSDTLDEITEISKGKINCCVAAFCGQVRLIDNIQIFL